MMLIKKLVLAALCVVFAGDFIQPSNAQETPRRKGNIVNRTAPDIGPARTAPLQQELPGIIMVSQDKARMIEMSRPVRKIVIGNENVADVHIDKANPNQVFIVSKSIGATNVFFMDSNGSVIHQAEIRVTLNPESLKAALKQLIPNETIEVSVFQDSVFLSGNLKSAPAVADAVRIAQRFVTANTNVTNMMKIVGSQQVILQVRVAEMDRSIVKNLTANQGLSLSAGPSNTVNTGDISLQTTSPSLDAFVTGTINHDILGLTPTTISALEQQSLVKTLAEPTLTAISGEQASFISGGQIPVPIGVDQNGNAIIEFRDYGIRLNFTPVVLSKGRINLQITSEISEIDTTVTVQLSGLTVNGFKTKRTESTVDLSSGGSLMLSGLLQDNVTDTIRGLPYLKDIPILGALFRSTAFQRDESELVITVTAYLAKPAGGNQLALPSDGFEPASDIDIYLLGRLHRQYGKGERNFWEHPVDGPFGYILK